MGYFNIHMDKIISNNVLKIVSLYVADYARKLHVREIARLLQANHRTIGLALQHLEKERVMDAVMVGKNKVCSLNINNITTKDYINMAEAMQKIMLLKKHFFLKKFLTELPMLGTEPLILFGSYAKGLEHKESDIDLLLIIEHKDSKIAAKIKELGKTYNKEVHLHRTTKDKFHAGLKEKDPLVVEIVHNHIILNNTDFFVELLWRHTHGR